MGIIIEQSLVNEQTAKALTALCPFGALSYENGALHVGMGCKGCKLCVNKGPKGVMRYEEEEEKKQIDKSLWRGVCVFAERRGDKPHPVTMELLGKARELAAVTGHPVYALCIGDSVRPIAEELLHYGADKVFVYDDPAFLDFCVGPYANAFCDFIRQIKPSSILVGATNLGRSLAPRVAALCETGLTADCTMLEMKENTDLVQIRPAFGGNIMAQIVTPNTRPQFATVRYKVMDTPQREETASGRVVRHGLPKKVSDCKVRLTKRRHVEKTANISDAEILVVGGRGLKSENDLQYVKELARLLKGEYAVSRPLVEKGWETNARQIGLSGRTVRPKLIITCGVSGAIQFTACMNAADRIVAINSDPNAPIFSVAHVGIVGDLYRVLPQLIEELKEKRGMIKSNGG